MKVPTGITYVPTLDLTIKPDLTNLKKTGVIFELPITNPIKGPGFPKQFVPYVEFKGGQKPDYGFKLILPYGQKSK